MKTLFRFTLAALLLLTINSFSQTGGTGEAVIDMTLNYAGGDNYSPGGGAEPGTAEITGEYFLRNSVFCDDFNRANSTNVVGWTEQSGDWQIYNNMLQIAPSASGWRYITVDGSAQTNGCITGRAIYGSISSVKFVGLVARYASGTSNIVFKIQDNTETIEDYFDSYWLYVDDALVTFTTGNNFGTDAIIQMEYTDANVTVRIDTDRNGTWDVTDNATVSNLNSGLCGVGSYGQDGFMDDYCCGATCETGNSVPISNMALFIALFLMVSFIIIRIYRR